MQTMLGRMEENCCSAAARDADEPESVDIGGEEELDDTLLDDEE